MYFIIQHHYFVVSCLFLLMQLLPKLNQVLLELKAFSPPMLQAARCLLTNQQGGDLAQMKISETLNSECKTQGAVVVHTIAVLLSHSKMEVLYPFIKMLENPASLMVNIVALLVEPSIYILMLAGAGMFRLFVTFLCIGLATMGALVFVYRVFVLKLGDIYYLCAECLFANNGRGS